MFNPSVDTTFSHDQERRHIEKYLATSNPFNATYGWKKSSVKIPLPHKGSKYKSECDPKVPWLTVDSVYHHDITDIIINTFKSKLALDTFHIHSYEEYWKLSDDSDPIRLFGECHIHKIVLSSTPDLRSHVHQLQSTFTQLAVRTLRTSVYTLLHSVPCTFDPSVLDLLLRFHRSCVQLQTQLWLYFSSVSAFVHI